MGKKIAGLVSVVMSTYKEPKEYVEAAIQSIIDQTHSNFEMVIIIDDPNNRQVIDLIQNFSKTDSRIRYYINEKNLGLVNSLNKALGYCTGEYIARMDADDISESNRFEEQLKYLRDHQLDIIGSSFYLFKEDPNSDLVEMKMVSTCKECLEKLKRNNALAHPSWFGKKELFDSLDGYRNILACEDYDFLIRSAEKGARIGNCPKFLLKYRYNTSGISRSNVEKQLLITAYLAKNFRSGKVITMEQYTEYVNSKLFMNECEKMSRVFLRIDKRKKESSFLKKLLLIFLIVSSPSFWKYKYISKT